MKLLSLILAASVASTLAACPNRCNGHGACGSADLCACQPRWTGADCSLRECPFGISWTVQGTGVIPGGGKMGGAHPYTECSSKGACDTSTGECQCYDGYEGRGCRRQSCPNDCSGNGRCVYNDEAVANYSSTNGARFSGQTWDAHATRVCACDRGYEGYDCSSRICPKGDDPVTDCATGGTADANSLAHHQVQRLYVLTAPPSGITHCSNNDYSLTAAECTAITDCDENGTADDSCTVVTVTDCTANTAAMAGISMYKVDGTSHATAINSCGPANDQALATGGSGNYYGYISLKYTDMFGGEYFTRPIFIDTTAFATQDATDILPANQWATTSDTMYWPASNVASAMVAGDIAATIFVGNSGGGQHFLNGAASATNKNVGQSGMHKKNLKRYTADRIRHALQDLPNFAIPQVNVTNFVDSGSAIWGNAFDITFGDAATAGKQALLECVYNSERSCDGAQPKMANLSPWEASKNGIGASDKIRTKNTNGVIAGETTYIHSCQVAEVPLAAGQDYEENSECANRGLCDSASGICSCFEGHTGENCATQTVFF